MCRSFSDPFSRPLRAVGLSLVRVRNKCAYVFALQIHSSFGFTTQQTRSFGLAACVPARICLQMNLRCLILFDANLRMSSMDTRSYACRSFHLKNSGPLLLSDDWSVLGCWIFGVMFYRVLLFGRPLRDGTRNPESSANWDHLPVSSCAGEEHREGQGKTHRNAGGQASTSPH